MQRIVILLSVLLLFCASAYAGQRTASGPVIVADRQAADVRVVMYVTGW